jgi:hypothetical protein
MLEGLEWIGGGDGGDGILEEGFARNSHMLELQELGGFVVPRLRVLRLQACSAPLKPC